jgi:hypothetical protein
MSLETWQWIKALSAVGQSDWHRQNRDSTLCLISCTRAAHQQLWRPQQADNHIRNDRRITTRYLAAILSIGKGSFDKIHQLGYSQACARWVLRSLTEERKEQRKIICSELLAHYKAESDEAYPWCLSHPQQAFNQMDRLTTLSLEMMPLRMSLTPYFLIPYLQASDNIIYKICSNQCGTIKFCLLTSLESE